MSSESQPNPAPAVAQAGFPRPFGRRYALLRALGAGGMGRLFLAVSGEAGTRRVCAIKTLALDDNDPDADDLRARFLDEARVVVRLSHDNLVYVFDAGVEDGERYLAMEYIPGKTLAQTLARGSKVALPLSLGNAMFVALELLSGLIYMHEFEGLNLVHRDISPSNVMIAYTGSVKLIDFGVAKWRDQVTKTQAGVQWGKNSYKAPEQHAGGAVDARSDMFSVGVLLWEMLARRQLFPGDELRPLRPDIPPPSRHNPEVPPELDAIVARATALDPADRFQSARQFHLKLAQFLRGADAKLKLAQLMAGLFSVEIADDQREVRLAMESPTSLAPTEVRDADRTDAPVHTSRPASDLVGTVIDRRYEVRRLVGRGAMGWVYEAQHIGIAKRVAIKIANPFERAPELTARLAVEAKAVARLEHPNVARVNDCGTTDDGALFVAMEFVDGQRLDQVIHAGAPMPVERAVDISVQIARALSAAHAAGIIHRDLKPANVMIVADDEGREVVKVLDFGLAKVADLSAEGSGDGVTKPDLVLGTPRYMAPEQIIRGRAVDARADLYALAVILYEMLTGHAPVEGTEPEVICRRKIESDAVPLDTWRKDLPADLRSLVRRTLSRNPLERPSTASELELALLDCLGERRRNDRRGASTTIRVSVPAKRPKRVVFAFAAVAIGIAGTALAVFRARSSPSSDPLEIPPPPMVQQPHSDESLAPTHQPSQTPALPRVRSAPPPAAGREDEAPSAGASAGAVKARQPATSEARIQAALDAAEEAYQRSDLLASLRSSRLAVKLGGGVEARLALARVLLAMDRPAEAETEYAAVLGMEPGHAHAREGLAKSRAKRRGTSQPERDGRPGSADSR